MMIKSLFFLVFIVKIAAGEMMMEQNPFIMEKEKVEAIISERGIAVHQLLQELIPIARSYARPPVSQYKVGVAGLGKSGRIYLGVNLEFPGFPLNQSVHGEQFLIALMRSHQEEEVTAIALSAAPCGHCRQFLCEMGESDHLMILMPNSKGTLATFLPGSFGPQDLGLTARLMHQDEASSLLQGYSPLAYEAVRAAEKSYAPYTHAKSGVAIRTKDGEIYAGSYLENAAFNPGLGPLQAALVNLVAKMKEYDEITDVILAERKSNVISYETITQELVNSIAPSATFETIKF
jgi:cytidine deaminase